MFYWFFLGGLKNDHLFLNRKGEAQDHMVSYKQREDQNAALPSPRPCFEKIFLRMIYLFLTNNWVLKNLVILWELKSSFTIMPNLIFNISLYYKHLHYQLSRTHWRFKANHFWAPIGTRSSAGATTPVNSLYGCGQVTFLGCSFLIYKWHIWGKWAQKDTS